MSVFNPRITGTNEHFLIAFSSTSLQKIHICKKLNTELCFLYETLFSAVLSYVLRAYSKANSLFPISFNMFLNEIHQVQTNQDSAQLFSNTTV